MSARRPALLGALLVAATLLAGCADGDEKSAPPPVVTPRPDLVQRADLELCPESSAESTDGGLPDLTLACLGEGPPVHLSGLRGKPTVVNFWAAWCITCRVEMPILNRAYADLAPQVRFIGIDTIDDANSALDFAVHIEPRMRYPSVFDPDKKALLAVGGTTGPPITLFLDATGRVVGRTFGPYRHEEDFRRDLQDYLGVSW